MDRSDLLLVSLGGGGNRLADTIIDTDPRFHGLFINTSITDMESLNNYNPSIKNYICISQQNGVGRNRDVGKEYAQQYSMSIVEKIMKYQQETIYLISSLGGGSGSSILTTTLEVLQNLKDEDALNKIINLICIIPDMKSPSIILENALETWDEIFQYSSLINSMIFVDNSAEIASATTNNDKELLINQHFAKLFDSIFDIPDYNGVNFDNGNLGNVLKDKGCLYIYNLPSGKSSIELAMRKAEQNSILAKMYRNDKNTVTLDNKDLMKVGYIGVSLNDENYSAEDLLENYSIRRETYIGKNEDQNIVLMSGCLPPSYTMEVLELELNDRDKNNNEDNFVLYHKSFSKNRHNKAKEALNQTSSVEKNNSLNSNKKLKKVMKKNLFKRD